MDATIYLDYASPYAYLAWKRATHVHPKRYRGHDLTWKPVSAAHIFKADGTAPNVTIPNQKQYLLRDVARWARHYDIPFAPPADGRPGAMPARSIEAMRLHFPAAEAGPEIESAWTDAVYDAYFGAGRDISDLGVLQDLADSIGLVVKVEDAVQDPVNKQALVTNTQEAYDAGAPGVPFAVCGGDVFWGNDRMEWLERALARQ